MAENKSEKFALQVGAVKPDLRANISALRKRADYSDRSSDSAMVSNNGNASLRLFDKKINQAASQNTSQKMTDKQSVSMSFEERHVTNRFSLEAYDFIFNGHKLNPNLWEYSDFKKYTDMYGQEHAVGGFTMMGTILTPSWDEQLHRYVLIRRQARMPFFSPKNNVPEILKTLQIDDPTKVAYKYGVKQSSETAQQYYERVGKNFDQKKYYTGATVPNSMGGGAGTATAEIIEKAVQWCIKIANDEDGQIHHYSQANRTGPDYDCTSFVCAGLQAAGLDIPYLGGSSFDSDILNYGFERLPFPGLEGLQRGDIMSNPSHVEWYIGNNQRCGAHTDSKPAEKQISVEEYWEGQGWTDIFRFKG